MKDLYYEDKKEINKLLAVEILEQVSSDIMTKRPITEAEIKAIERAIPRIFDYYEVALYLIGRLIEWKSEKKGE
jgi:hypothetical protein